MQYLRDFVNYGDADKYRINYSDIDKLKQAKEVNYPPKLTSNIIIPSIMKLYCDKIQLLCINRNVNASVKFIDVNESEIDTEIGDKRFQFIVLYDGDINAYSLITLDVISTSHVIFNTYNKDQFIKSTNMQPYFDPLNYYMLNLRQFDASIEKYKRGDLTIDKEPEPSIFEMREVIIGKKYDTLLMQIIGYFKYQWDLFDNENTKEEFKYAIYCANNGIQNNGLLSDELLNTLDFAKDMNHIMLRDAFKYLKSLEKPTQYEKKLMKLMQQPNKITFEQDKSHCIRPNIYSSYITHFIHIIAIIDQTILRLYTYETVVYNIKGCFETTETHDALIEFLKNVLNYKNKLSK